MAILSNINGKFRVDSAGAVYFGTSAGTNGQILKSVGTGGSPVWIDQTDITGPFVLKAGDTMTGPLVINGSNSLTVGGVLTVNGIGTFNTPAGGVAFNVDAFTDGYGVIRFRTNSNASKWDIGMNSSNHFYIGNNGVNTALEIEEVSSNATFEGTVQVNGSNVTVINASDPNITVSDDDTNYRGSMRWLTSSNVLEFFTRYAGTYYTNNLVLDRGNVGIGTDSPAQKLHIKSTTSGPTGIIIENTNNAQSLDLDFWNNAGAVQGRIRYNEGGGTFSFFPNASVTSAMEILYNGNVGIGTTSPNQKLVVQADWNGSLSNNQQLQIQGDTDTTLQLRLGYDTTNDYAEIAALKSGTGYKNLILNRGGARIGIGTNLPTQTLDVAGQVTHEGLVLKNGTGLYIDQITSFNITLDFVAGNWIDTGLTSLSNGGLSLGESGTYIMQIYSDDHSPGEPHWYSMYWSGIMSWYASNTNQSTAIPVPLQRAGHGDNNRTLDARILWQNSLGTPPQAGLLQLNCNVTAPGTNLSLRFRRLL